MSTQPRRRVTPEHRDEDADASLRPQARANLAVLIVPSKYRRGSET